MCALWLGACASTAPYIAPAFRDAPPAPTGTPVVYRVFLVGNTGVGPDAPSEAVLDALRTQLRAADSASALVFLGDALPPTTEDDDPAVQAVLDLARTAQGRVLFLPGDRDWRGGLAGLARREALIETAVDRGNVFVPDEGFPGPVEIELAEGITLLALDTAWWLHEGEKSFGETDDYDVDSPADVLLQLDDLIKRHDDDRILVVGHHPTHARGPHAGHLPFLSHLFPLRHVWRPAFLPLPIAGSFYPLYRRYAGAGPQDIAHPRYGSLRRGLDDVFKQHDGLVYAAAHDPGLQVFPVHEGRQVHLVSGAGGGSGHVARGGPSAFTFGGPGFTTLTYHADGSVWLDAWGFPDSNADAARRLFRYQVQGPIPERVDPGVPILADAPDYRDSVVVTSINPSYRGNPITRTLFGRNYRRAWAAPTPFPVLDLGHEAGGLTPVKRGGSAQTRSLRLRNPEGREFVLRSVDKSFASFQDVFGGTLAADLAQEQTSILHPFAAVTTAHLAHAAGLYHALPRIVYVPDDPRLGIYRADFADRVMLLEERPDDDMSDAPAFGHAPDVIGHRKLYREITDDNDHRVDARTFALARLFDIWVSDWDRHEDQWRWAAFEPHELDPSLEGEARTQGKIYRPIPRDRDWALGRSDGLLSPVVSYFQPEYQYFGSSFGFIPGLTLKGRTQDRRLLSELTRDDWLALADTLRARLTDDVIAAAVQQWPESLYRLDGPRTERLLRERRDALPRAAERYYRFHARVVDVVGSHKHERFEITRGADSTHVVAYKTRKDGEIRGVYYRRGFAHDETEEIRLYGLDGDDQFIVEGAARSGPRVIAVGGPGSDRFVDRADVGRFGPHTHFFDTPTGDAWDIRPETRVRTSTDPAVNAYEPGGYTPNWLRPRASFATNRDDGAVFGAGFLAVRHGFRKEPYAQVHRLDGTIATNEGAATLNYRGEYIDAVGTFDLRVHSAVLFPGNFLNFYGFGNETERGERSARFYRTAIRQARLKTALQLRRPLGLTVRLGPVFEWTAVDEDPDRFAGQPGLPGDVFGTRLLAGLEGSLSLESVDRPFNPRQGFRWRNEVGTHVGVRDRSNGYGRLASMLTVYVSPIHAPQVTLAARFGAAHNTGAFPFYRANTLGGKSTLRGYRSTRFSGRSSAYLNTELRVKLLNYRTYLAIGELGLMAFHDTGRVWADGERSDRWHRGYGGGLWTNVFDAAVLSGVFAISPEERTFALRMGFFF